MLEAATRDQATNARLAELDRVARERDDRLRERVEALVSAAGALAQRTR